MKYVTLIYYTKNGKAMMMPFENSGENVQEAYQETQDALHRVNKQASRQGGDHSRDMGSYP